MALSQIADFARQVIGHQWDCSRVQIVQIGMPWPCSQNAPDQARALTPM
jgi:hypothetical protein